MAEFTIQLDITLKSNISDIYSHRYTKIKINSDDDLFLEKTKTTHIVVILIKSVFNENHIHYYYVFRNNMKILYYGTTDLSKGIHVNKKRANVKYSRC